MNPFQVALNKYIEDNSLSYRAMEKRAGVSRSLICNMLHPSNDFVEPKLSTLAVLCNEIGFPLWKAIEAYGFNLGLSDTGK